MSSNNWYRCRIHRQAQAQLALILALALIMFSMPSSAGAAAVPEDRFPTAGGDLAIQPINHASFVMSWQEQVIYVDPVGAAERYQGLPAPDLILITHEHQDHMSPDTLRAIGGAEAPIVAPESVRDKLPPPLAERVKVMQNGDTTTIAGIAISAIPAYNTSPERQQYHPKGRDNGYVLSLADLQVYIAGDTEDIPEMRALRNIDIAFLPMNLPYTMTVQQAASAVRAFAPRVVYPYHSRDSDVQEFARLVGEDNKTEVRLRDWYQGD